MPQEAAAPRVASRNEFAEQQPEIGNSQVETVVRELLHTFRTEERKQLNLDRCVTVCPHSLPCSRSFCLDTHAGGEAQVQQVPGRRARAPGPGGSGARATRAAAGP